MTGSHLVYPEIDQSPDTLAVSLRVSSGEKRELGSIVRIGIVGKVK